MNTGVLCAGNVTYVPASFRIATRTLTAVAASVTFWENQRQSADNEETGSSTGCWVTGQLFGLFSGGIKGDNAEPDEDDVLIGGQSSSDAGWLLRLMQAVRTGFR